MKKSKRGGKSFIERNLGIDANTSGPFIADNIEMNVRHKNKVGLLTEYETRKTDAEKNYQEIERKFNENHKQRLEEDTLYFKVKQQKDLQRDRFYKNSGNVISAIVKFFNTLAEYVFKIGKFIISSGGNIIGKIADFIASIAKTPVLNTIVKTLILIGIVLLIIFGSLGFFSSNSSNPAGTSIGNLETTAQNMANTNTFFIKTPQPPTIFGAMGLTFKNLVPEKYRIQFTAFKNNVNKAFGNDLTENSMYNLKRNELKTGRADDIIHINLDNNNDKIYTMVKPKNIIIDINYNDMNKNADLHKLPSFIKDKYVNNFKKLLLEGRANEKGLFIFPATDISYIDSNNNKIKLSSVNIESPYLDSIYSPNSMTSNNYILNEIDMKKNQDIFYKSNKPMEYNESGVIKYPTNI